VWTGFIVVQDRDQWWVLVNTVMNHRIPYLGGEFVDLLSDLAFQELRFLEVVRLFETLSFS
jgi:hypothetical protein